MNLANVVFELKAFEKLVALLGEIGEQCASKKLQSLQWRALPLQLDLLEVTSVGLTYPSIAYHRL